MKFFSVLATIFFSALTLTGQTHRTVLTLEPNNPNAWFENTIELPKYNGAFLAVSAVWQGEAEALSIRYSEDKRAWTGATRWSLDSHVNFNSEDKISQLLFIEAKYRFIQVATQGGVNSIDLHFFDPGEGEATGAASETLEKRACPCPQPEYLDRDGWCPSGDCPNNPSQPTTVTTHLIVHHSATANSASDWSAVVRSIWDFHVNVRGWADIGYNWLIAPTGQVFEGRGDDILGAHFGCEGLPGNGNINTTGICVIGTYTTETPSTAARNSLKEMLAWKACDADIDPEGMSFHSSSQLLLDHIAGHRQGCSTECPGNAFFPLLPEVRSETATYIASACSGVASPSQLDAENAGADVALTWTDNTEDEIAFELERSKALPNNYSLIATVEANETTYLDTDVDPNSGFYYRIRALTETDTSAYSNEVFIFTAATSTSSLFEDGTVRLFPNPAKQQITLQMENDLLGMFSLEVINSLGQVVIPARKMDKQAVTLSVPLAVKKLSSGSYWLRITHQNETGAIPFIVE